MALVADEEANLRPLGLVHGLIRSARRGRPNADRGRRRRTQKLASLHGHSFHGFNSTGQGRGL
jgi:hypothetical protein